MSNSAHLTEAATVVCDILVKPAAFEATETELVAVTAAGRNLFGTIFGAGAVSVTLRKSMLVQFAAFATSKGVCVSTFAVAD